jgi:hypothetical protein
MSDAQADGTGLRGSHTQTAAQTQPLVKQQRANGQCEYG